MTRARLSSQPLRHLQDRIATALITAGGIGVLLAVLGIGVFLLWEAAPLLFSEELGSLSMLTPLAWGTLKAALMALLFALPLALGAAAYSAFFMSPRLRSRIKPTLEMMEAIPGVVVGFIAGMVLAPGSSGIWRVRWWSLSGCRLAQGSRACSGTWQVVIGSAACPFHGQRCG